MRWIRFVGLGGLVLFLISAFTPVPNILDRWVAMPPILSEPTRLSCWEATFGRTGC